MAPPKFCVNTYSNGNSVLFQCFFFLKGNYISCFEEDNETKKTCLIGYE